MTDHPPPAEPGDLAALVNAYWLAAHRRGTTMPETTKKPPPYRLLIRPDPLSASALPRVQVHLQRLDGPAVSTLLYGVLTEAAAAELAAGLAAACGIRVKREGVGS